MADQPQLYLITPPAFELTDFVPRLSAVLDGAGIGCLRLALATRDEDRVARTADALREIAHARDVAIVIESHAALVERLGLDGVHLPDGARTVRDVRKLLGADGIVGTFSRASRHDGISAAEAGADYVAFGAFFATHTKTPKTSASVDLLTWWQQLFEIPCVAIGGITVDNCPPLITAGADFIAVSAGVWSHADGPKAAVAAFNEMCERHPYVDPSHPS
jgi:thiamine-phosphate pyrophosphorylase